MLHIPAFALPFHAEMISRASDDVELPFHAEQPPRGLHFARDYFQQTAMPRGDQRAPATASTDVAAPITTRCTVGRVRDGPAIRAARLYAGEGLISFL